MNGLKHQKEKRSMDHFAGLDVSVKDTNVCITGGQETRRGRPRPRQIPRPSASE